MTSRYIVDIEADGLLDTITTVHCVVALDIETSEVHAFHDNTNVVPRSGSTVEGLEFLRGSKWVGHNIIGYDIPAIQKVYPAWVPPPQEDVFDTVVASRFKFSSGFFKTDEKIAKLRPKIYRARRKSGEHSLAAWGYRIGEYKGDFGGGEDPWSVFTQEMLDYCIQDTKVNLEVFKRLDSTSKASLIEQRFAWILQGQESRGIHVSKSKLDELHKTLELALAEVTPAAEALFPPRVVKMKTPQYWVDPETGDHYRIKGDAKSGEIRGRLVEGPKKTKEIPFNPGSSVQIADRLQEVYGWDPQDYTNTGRPMTGAEVLADLPYDCIPTLLEYSYVSKYYSQVAGGAKAWVHYVVKEPDGSHKIYGRCKHIGTRTHRCAHSSPNLGQTPAVGKRFGAECREVFIPRPGWLMVGCDAQGLEGRVKAHYLESFDGGSYIQTVLEGSKSDGTDIHGLNATVLGLDYGVKEERDRAKTFYYAWLYGAGDAKLGGIMANQAPHPKLRKVGARYRAKLEDGIPGLGELIAKIKSRSKRHGVLTLIDGVSIESPSEHAAPNTLFQGTGARIMKWVTVKTHDLAAARGLVEDQDYGQVLHVHDELQIEARPEVADLIAELAVKAYEVTTKELGLRCPLDGESQIGKSWRDTH